MRKPQLPTFPLLAFIILFLAILAAAWISGEGCIKDCSASGEPEFWCQEYCRSRYRGHP